MERELVEPVEEKPVEIEKQSFSAEEIVERHFNESQQHILAYVDEQIQKMEAGMITWGLRGVKLNELSEALSNHLRTDSALQAMRADAESEHDRVKALYDSWMAEKRSMVEQELNPRSMPATKFYSREAINDAVISRFKNEYIALRARLSQAETQRNTMEALCKGWANYQYTLSRISANSCTEADIESRGSGYAN